MPTHSDCNYDKHFHLFMILYLEIFTKWQSLQAADKFKFESTPMVLVSTYGIRHSILGNSTTVY